MSFFINNPNQQRPGTISNNPTQGLCEKMLIETTRIFDSCMQTITEQGLVLPLTNLNPPDPALPLTYISADSNIDEMPIVSDVVITRLESRPEFAKVSGQIIIPLIVTYRDANGVLGTANSNYTTTFNTILFVPQPALSPVRVKVTGQFSSTIGTFTPPSSFTVTGCVQIIIKIVADVDILIPSYGYPFIPPCQNIVNECPGIGDIPIYPTLRNPSQTNISNNNIR